MILLLMILLEFPNPPKPSAPPLQTIFNPRPFISGQGARIDYCLPSCKTQRPTIPKPIHTMTTLAQSSIALGNLTSIQTAAAANGMTVNQMAAAQYIASLGPKLSAEAKAVLANKDSALRALARIAEVPMLDETHEARIARIQSAILA